jgi:hypothetical protein
MTNQLLIKKNIALRQAFGQERASFLHIFCLAKRQAALAVKQAPQATVGGTAWALAALRRNTLAQFAPVFAPGQPIFPRDWTINWNRRDWAF